MYSGKKQTQDKERSEYYADNWFIIVPPEGLSNGNGVGLDLVHEIGLLIIAKRSVALEEGGMPGRFVHNRYKYMLEYGQRGNKT